jgi:hypothetical protein
MGSVKVLTAKYTVSDQTIDVMDVLTDNQSRNYGKITILVSKLDADLRKNNQIATPADADALKLTPPELKVQYLDGRGLWHEAKAKISETLDIGERSAFGKFVQKPGDVLWGIGITAAKAQFLFVVVLGWTLVVLWTYRQWKYIEEAMQPTAIAGYNGAHHDYSEKDFGLVGQWVVWMISKFYSLFYYPSLLLGIVFKNPPYGWLVKVIMSIGSGVAPISGFIVQVLIWFTAVVPIQELKTRVPVTVASAARDGVNGVAGMLAEKAGLR